MSSFKFASKEQVSDILYLVSTLPSLFSMLHRGEAGRVGYLCKTIAQNINNMPTEVDSSQSNDP